MSVEKKKKETYVLWHPYRHCCWPLVTFIWSAVKEKITKYQQGLDINSLFGSMDIALLKYVDGHQKLYKATAVFVVVPPPSVFYPAPRRFGQSPWWWFTNQCVFVVFTKSNKHHGQTALWSLLFLFLFFSQLFVFVYRIWMVVNSVQNPTNINR